MRIDIDAQDIFLGEPVGKQEKYWFLSYDKKYLFKKESLKQDGSSTYNDVSECMAMEVAKLLDIPTAEYYLCKQGGMNGVITPDFLRNSVVGPKKEELFDGVYLINQIDPGFKNKAMVNPTTHQFYTVDLVLRSVEKYGLMQEALEMIVFDALIANRDRNPSNYGIIVNHETGKVRFSPLYDSCASLGVSMVDHRLEKCIDTRGMVVDGEHLKVVIHNHIIGKVTLERHFQYVEKRIWDEQETKRILTAIETKRSEILPLLESGQMSREEYHRILNNIGNEYRKYDITILEYQPLISYLTLFYPEEISRVMENIESNINEITIQKAFDAYQEELPVQRMMMAKKIVLERAKWMVEYYQKNKQESMGRLL